MGKSPSEREAEAGRVAACRLPVKGTGHCARVASPRFSFALPESTMRSLHLHGSIAKTRAMSMRIHANSEIRGADEL